MRSPNPIVPPRSPRPAPPDPPDVKPKRGDPARFVPLWIFSFALLLVMITIFMLVSGPVERQVAAMQPTPTITHIPTYTPTPSRTPTPVPTPTSTPLPTLEPRPDLNPASDLRSIRMLNSQEGWGLGERGLWRTSNGGETWVDVTPPDISPRLEGMTGFFLSSQQAWYLAPVGDPNSELGKLYRTEDGGKVWLANEVNFGLYGTGLYFLDDLHGWVLTTGVHAARNLLSTVDGGTTWKVVHQVSLEPAGRTGIMPPGGGGYGPVYNSLAHGWAVFTGFIPSASASLYESTDGGLIWQPADLRLPETESFRYISFPAFFGKGSQNGVVAASISPVEDLRSIHWVFYTSSDGGVTWHRSTPLDLSKQPLGTPSLPAIASPNTFYVYTPGTLFYSRDSGKTWQSQVPNFHPLDQETFDASQFTVRGISFPDEMTGFLWSSGSGQLLLYRTNNGGVDWDQIDVK